MSDESAEQQNKGGWFKNAFWFILIGSLAPFGVHSALTNPDFFNREPLWKVLAMPFGFWLLFGLLINGLVTAWVGGVKKEADWEKRAEAAVWRWNKLGLWLVAIAVGIVAVIWLFGSVSDFFSDIPSGTRLIAFLLFMILIALWGIADKLNKRK